MCGNFSRDRAHFGNRDFAHYQVFHISRHGRPCFSASHISLALFLLASVAWSQETVTIPKSRLEELERKEAELERLKGPASKPQSPPQNSTPQKPRELVPEQVLPQTTATSSSPSIGATPSLSSLPPLENGTIVSASDLAAHYRADSAAADQRYRKHIFKVQGEIIGFEKPPLIRNYFVLLKTADPQRRIVCDFYPSDKFKAVFTIDSGTALVGVLPGETRAPLAKVGETAVIEGRCKGLSGGGVKLTGCELKAH
jgi:hypothetical protein